jgi:hypothetical protein
MLQPIDPTIAYGFSAVEPLAGQRRALGDPLISPDAQR